MKNFQWMFHDVFVTQINYLILIWVFGDIDCFVWQRKLESENNTGDWESVEQVFLVCVYNVAPDQPYTIFKAPTSSNAQDIITQVRVVENSTL